MATTVINQFTSYLMTEEEVLSGSVLTELQRMRLQNMLVESSREKVELKYDASDLHRSIQYEAELHGRIMLLQQLLQDSIEAQSAKLPSHTRVLDN